MSRNKYSRALWIAAAGAVFAWPIGKLVGLVLAAGQDGPGRSLAHAIGDVTSLVIWAISLVVVLVYVRKGFRHLGKGARIAVGLSIVFLPASIIVSVATFQDYDLRVWNETEDPIDSVVVRMSGKRYSFGAMNSGVDATIAFQQERPTGRAEIRWTGADGRSHTVEVDVSELVPRRYDKGLLTFTIYPDENVKVGFLIRQQEFPF